MGKYETKGKVINYLQKVQDNKAIESSWVINQNENIKNKKSRNERNEKKYEYLLTIR